MRRLLLALVLSAASSPLVAQRPQPSTVDVLIRGGRVIDGTGSDARRDDVGITGDRIVFVGNSAVSRVTGRRTIDVPGLVVAPGFIDPHTHTLEDLSTRERRANLPYLMQGVTTVITGNDGGGPVDVAARLSQWERDRIGTNAALLVGQGAVREAVVGTSARPPAPEELERMRALVARAMSEGALGLSAGLYYAPGSYATTEEVIELARVAAAHGGIYDTHLRDESSYTVGLVGAVNEAIRIGREARIPVNISHVKALGADVWGQSDTVIALIKAARAAGVSVTADQYPYTASGSTIGAALLPRWAESGGRDSLLARIASPAASPALAAAMRENLRRRGGAEALLITSAADVRLVGKTLAVVASDRNVDAVDAALEIITAGDAGVASFTMRDADIEAFMVQDFVMTGSDGSEGHPRKYGAFARKLAEYVRVKGTLTLPAAIRAATSLPAATFHLADRGVLAPGHFADVIVFDPETVEDHATYSDPQLLATGMRYVFVNGVAAVDDGQYTGTLAGRPLRLSAGGK
jgi:N-acyl-D-amino-acid deacylase